MKPVIKWQRDLWAKVCSSITEALHQKSRLSNSEMSLWKSDANQCCGIRKVNPLTQIFV